MIGFLVALFVSTAEAGAPPPDLIPWDTVYVADTLETSDGRPVVSRYPVLFITRTDYEREVLGWETPAQAQAVKRDLEQIKALIRAKKAGP